MGNSIWNHKIGGLPGALSNIISVLYARIANYLTTRMMLGNIKHHGHNILIMRGCIYRNPNKIEFADNVIIGKKSSFVSEECIIHDNDNFVGSLVVNKGVSIGNNCEIDFTGGVIIGEYAHIAHGVMISTHDHGYDYRNKPIGKALIINNNAFIGSRSCILHNCCYIGKYAVIGTGSVVTKDVPDYAIVAGNPAKIIKYIVK